MPAPATPQTLSLEWLRFLGSKDAVQHVMRGVFLYKLATGLSPAPAYFRILLLAIQLGILINVQHHL
jgi:hypothetical protein